MTLKKNAACHSYRPRRLDSVLVFFFFFIQFLSFENKRHFNTGLSNFYQSRTVCTMGHLLEQPSFIIKACFFLTGSCVNRPDCSLTLCAVAAIFNRKSSCTCVNGLKADPSTYCMQPINLRPSCG